MNFRTTICIGAMLMSLTPLVSEAQIVKKAQVGFRFLENPVSAEVMGRGGVGVVNTMTSNSVFWNPALLGWVKPDIDLSLNHVRGIAEINYNAVAASARLGDFGVLGFSLLAMDYGDFYTTVRAANEQGYMETGTFSPTALAIGTAFSQRVSERFSYGVHVKYVRQNLGDAWVSTAGDSLNDPRLALEKRKYVRDVVAFDVGAYYDFLYNGITFGATLQNISRELQFENEEFPLPFAVSFGLTIEPLQFFFDRDTLHNVVLAIESKHPRDFGEKVKVGGEYNFANTFIARVGYASNYTERGWTFGFGVQQEIGGFPLRVDYAYEPFGVLGGRHFISLGIGY
ncbi:MAG: PorV/PorQ family protein [Ignavibacteriae bacterium]|nr:PorV/PorQ family protein [Ignavibacteriota bacterium]